MIVMVVGVVLLVVLGVVAWAPWADLDRDERLLRWELTRRKKG